MSSCWTSGFYDKYYSSLNGTNHDAVLLGEEEPGELLKVPGKVLANFAISLM